MQWGFLLSEGFQDWERAAQMLLWGRVNGRWRPFWYSATGLVFTKKFQDDWLR